jgi:hypothetical protein
MTDSSHHQKPAGHSGIAPVRDAAEMLRLQMDILSKYSRRPGLLSRMALRPVRRSFRPAPLAKISV